MEAVVSYEVGVPFLVSVSSFHQAAPSLFWFLLGTAPACQGSLTSQMLWAHPMLLTKERSKSTLAQKSLKGCVF